MGDIAPLFGINYVKWNDNSNARVLKSVDEIIESQNNGELSITDKYCYQ